MAGRGERAGNDRKKALQPNDFQYLCGSRLWRFSLFAAILNLYIHSCYQAYKQN
jgi:hypothetical protein